MRILNRCKGHDGGKMTAAEKWAYQRGYQMGLKAAWPCNKPPIPPHPILASIFSAMKKLRDGVDAHLSTIMPDDEWSLSLGPLIDEADEACTAMEKWCAEFTEQQP